MENKNYENTKHPVRVGGKNIQSHTAKPIDPHNPKREYVTPDAEKTAASAAESGE